MSEGVIDGDDRRMSVVEHLTELRRALIIAGSAWVLATVLAFIVNARILELLLRPLKSILPRSNHVVDQAIYLSPTEGLTIPLKISAAAGLVLALPVILWQAWGFVSPGLRAAERRFAAPFLASALTLFVAGAGFAYLVMPIGLNFLATFLAGNATYFPDIDEYLSFLVLLIVVFGVTFELPVVIILLGLLGLVSSRRLREWRRGAWVLIILAALIVTPGADPFTPTALFIPLIALFEASVLVLDRIFHK